MSSNLGTSTSLSEAGKISRGPLMVQRDSHASLKVRLAALLVDDVSLAYRILRGERQSTAPQIRKVATHYGLDPTTLLG